MSPGFLFAVLSSAGLIGVMVRGFLAGGPRIAIGLGVAIGIPVCTSLILFETLGWFSWGLPLLLAAGLAFGFGVARARMRSPAYRWLVTLPGSAFGAAGWLAIPWAILVLLGFDPWLPWLPFAIAAVSTVRSLQFRTEELDIVLDQRPVEGLRPVGHGAARTSRPLRVVQITDPHLGPFMSVARLRAACQRAVDRDPDLILLTGDYLTYESNNQKNVLEQALEPLQALPGRVFAIRGNHDLEVAEQVALAMEHNGIPLLIDESVMVDTAAGPVQIVGLDFCYQHRKRSMEAVLDANPRVGGALRLILLHDPAAFGDLPVGQADLTLSGHTHGGQVGLLNLGHPWTVVRALGIPDHGLWGRGPDRLYVHRGTGHYGFPIRVGVPAEESLLRVHLPAALRGAR
jgi:predicted MPP superfamily phosphohydrolase